MKNKKRNFKIILIILTLIMLIISIYKIATTYAVFQSEISAVVSKQLGKWNIIINNTDISSGMQKEFLIDTFNIQKSKNVEENKIAPGLSGDFEIVINPNDTDVSIKYEVNIDTSKIKDYAVTIESVKEIEQKNTLVQTNPNTYTGIIPLEKIKNGEKNTIKIVFNWENNEEKNNEDTKIGTTISSKLEIPVTVKVSQYLGEEI